MIIANDVKTAFSSDENQVTIITKECQIELELASKYSIARQIIEAIATRSKT